MCCTDKIILLIISLTLSYRSLSFSKMSLANIIKNCQFPVTFKFAKDSLPINQRTFTAFYFLTALNTRKGRSIKEHKRHLMMA